MAIASGWAGRVLAQPLFHRPNLHMRTLNCVISYKLCHPQKATQGNTSSGFTAISVHSVATYLGSERCLGLPSSVVEFNEVCTQKTTLITDSTRSVHDSRKKQLYTYEACESSCICGYTYSRKKQLYTWLAKQAFMFCCAT